QRAGYRTLSDAPAAAPTPPAAIRVVPDPTMPLGEWNALLRGLELQVVEGPNAVGAYLLAPAAPTQAQAAQLLQRLRSAPGIRLAESVAAR
ncbi:zf-HC2 domain-containing protein, partial [Salinisphaera sp. USBA-960]|nr:zf-HC2 domain-containing protein [Salifodinibacter halophilus]